METGKIILVLTLLSVGCWSCQQTSPSPRPNVVVILTDDQGYGDAGFQGNPHIATPHLDSLASNSIQFTRFYVSPVCAPTRAALLTGRYPMRTGVYHVTAGGHVMDPDEVTLGEYFHAAGYRTAMIGKWHLGDHYPYLPHQQGFEQAWYHGGGAVGQLSDHPANYWDMTKPLNQRKQCYFDPVLYYNGKPQKTNGYISNIFTDKAIEFVELPSEQPFFLYLAYNAPHDPFQVPEAYLERYPFLPDSIAANDVEDTAYRLNNQDAARYVYAMMSNLDDNLKRLTRAIQNTKAQRETILMYLSDNGPAHYRWRQDLRGKKATLYEGGIRVPAFLHIPDKYQGDFWHKPAAHVDVLPTLAAICDINLTNSRLDGQNLLAMMESSTVPDRWLFFRETGPLGANQRMMVLNDSLKFIRNTKAGAVPERELYHITRDKTEQNNLVTSSAQVAKHMEHAMDSIYEELVRSPHLHVQPIPVTHMSENPIRLTRHEIRPTRAGNWFSQRYEGYYVLKADTVTVFNVTLEFLEDLPDGEIFVQAGPVTQLLQVQGGKTNYQVDSLAMPAGTNILQCWFEKKDAIISPFTITLTSISK